MSSLSIELSWFVDQLLHADYMQMRIFISFVENIMLVMLIILLLSWCIQERTYFYQPLLRIICRVVIDGLKCNEIYSIICTRLLARAKVCI